jgi:hypothetical protein
MSYEIRRIDYFYITVRDEPGQAYQLLQQMADLGVNMVAFAAAPTGPETTQLTLFPEDTLQLQNVAKRSGMPLVGPHGAFLVQGTDELGGLIRVHQLLYDAKINIYASNGVTGGEGHLGYVIYVRPEEYEKAAQALEI